MNFCLCGAEAGYPHVHTCPRPLYRCSQQQEAAWQAEHERLVALHRGCEECGKPCGGRVHCSNECAGRTLSRRDGNIIGQLGE